MPRDRPPGIWESLKRALAGPGPRPESPPPSASQPPEPPTVTSYEGADLAPPPFLLPDEPLPPSAGTPPIPATSGPPPAAVAAPPEPAELPGTPRLARGLASFSRANADREKKFAHLLRDDDSGAKKKKKKQQP